MDSDPQYARDPSSVTAILQQLEEHGYTGQFMVREGARLLCSACREEHEAAAFEMTSLRRTEGASDPDDMAAIVGLTCPGCSSRGTVVLKYGPEAGPEESDVLLALDDERQGAGVIVDPSVLED